MPKKITSFFIVLFFIFSCCYVSAGEKQLTRQEWLAMTTHVFNGVSIDDVLIAGEKVLRLAYKKTNIVHSLSSMSGSKGDLLNFNLTATQKEDAVLTELRISESSGGGDGVTYTPKNLGGMGVALTAPFNTNTIKYKEAYDLFFNRMESLLYGSRWISCNELMGKSPVIMDIVVADEADKKDGYISRKIKTLQGIMFYD